MFLNETLKFCKKSYKNTSLCNLWRCIFGRCLIKNVPKPFLLFHFKKTLFKPLKFFKLSELTFSQNHSTNFNVSPINIKSIKELTQLKISKFLIFLNFLWFSIYICRNWWLGYVIGSLYMLCKWYTCLICSFIDQCTIFYVSKDCMSAIDAMLGYRIF